MAGYLSDHIAKAEIVERIGDAVLRVSDHLAEVIHLIPIALAAPEGAQVNRVAEHPKRRMHLKHTKSRVRCRPVSEIPALVAWNQRIEATCESR